MPEQNYRDPDFSMENIPGERTLVHRILRYVPNLLRDEWVNIGVLLYDPSTGERRLRLIEDTTEFNRVRRLHPRFDESALRGLRDHLESRIGAAMTSNGGGVHSDLRSGLGNPKLNATEWFQVLEKWDATLSQSLQLADPKATIADDINAEIDRLYDERVGVIVLRQQHERSNRLNSRAKMRRYCQQVFQHARIWNHIRPVPMREFTFESDRAKIDFGYHVGRKRGFIQTVPISRNASDARLYADAAQQITKFSEDRFDAELTAVTDVPIDRSNADHNFVRDLFQARGIEPVPLDNFAVFVAKLRPMLQ